MRPAEVQPETSGAAAESRQRLVRLVLAALLVAAVVAGLRGEPGPISFRDAPRARDLAVGLALEAVLALALIALAIRRRRAPPAAILAGRLRGALSAAITAGLVVIPVALLLTSLPKARARPRPPIPAPRAGNGRAHPKTAPLRPVHLPVSTILTVLLVLALAAAIVACVIVLRRRPRHPAEAGLAPEDDEETLREAVESGRTALRELDDARAAIIACDLAMERRLAGAGAARGTAETPDELLARAASAGLVRGDAARRLTVLFYEARFSSHPLPAAARTAARQALGELAASIAAPAGAGPAGAGEARP